MTERWETRKKTKTRPKSGGFRETDPKKKTWEEEQLKTKNTLRITPLLVHLGV